MIIGVTSVISLVRYPFSVNVCILTLVKFSRLIYFFFDCFVCPLHSTAEIMYTQLIILRPLLSYSYYAPMHYSFGPFSQVLEMFFKQMYILDLGYI